MEDEKSNVTPGADEQPADDMEKALAEARQKAETNLAGWQRTQADLANYKKMAAQEKEELSKFAGASLMLGILPVLDDLERAFATMPKDMQQAKWADGFKLIGKKLETVLANQGLASIKAVGEPFDPRFHEATRQVNGKDGKIIFEDQKGYVYHERVIRPSKVAVGNGEHD